MGRRLVGALVAAAVAGSARAAEPITLTAEAVEVVWLKADQAKVYLTVEAKDGSAEEAVKANTDAKKKLVEAVEKAGVKGLRTTALQQKVTKERDNNNRVFRAGPGGPIMPPPPVESYTVAQPMVFTVADADADKLVSGMEKVLQAAAGVGVTGDQRGNPDHGYSPYGETKFAGRVTYLVKDGWDAATAAALTKATARAVKNAEALAKGAGLKVIQVQAVEDVSEAAAATTPAATNRHRTAPNSPAASACG